MNTVRDRALREMEEDVMRCDGRDAFRLQALRHLRLKTVVKESHKSPILDTAWNRSSPELQNLFATVGGDQATVYDDRHMGSHIAVVLNFPNIETVHHTGGNLRACSWISNEGITHHPHGDACLAVSGSDSAISIISVVEARVVSLLTGHTNEVVETVDAPGQPGLLCSLSREGNLRLWDVPNSRCIASVSTDAFTMDVEHSGSSIITGHSDGSVQCWLLHVVRTPIQPKAQMHSSQAAAAACVLEVKAEGSVFSSGAPGIESKASSSLSLCLDQVLDPRAKAEGAICGSANPLGLQAEDNSGSIQPPPEALQPYTLSLEGCNGGAVQCVRVLPGERLVVMSSDGHMGVWPLPSCSSTISAPVCRWQVPGVKGSADRETNCRVSFTSDGDFLCVGTQSGDVYVFSSLDGQIVGHVCGNDVKGGQVRACLLSDDCRHLIAAVSTGFLLRFEYCPPDNNNSKAQKILAARSPSALHTIQEGDQVVSVR